MVMPDIEVTLLYISHAHILHYWIGQGLSLRHTTLSVYNIMEGDVISPLDYSTIVSEGYSVG